MEIGLTELGVNSLSVILMRSKFSGDFKLQRNTLTLAPKLIECKLLHKTTTYRFITVELCDQGRNVQTAPTYKREK